MINFLLLMLIPLLIAILTLVTFKDKVLVSEFMIQVGAVALIMALGMGIAYWHGTDDAEIWNGQVTTRTREQVSCSHSYDCNCFYTTECTGSGKDRSCSEVRHCSTCYEHPFDVDWGVAASTGESIEINRVDSQGLVMPDRWTHAYVGEPFSSRHIFTNYIMANPDSVLLGTKGDMQRFGKLIPKYPDEIYDYYNHNSAINIGVPNVDIAAWNYLIGQANKTLGPKKQANIILILVPTDDRAYMYALKDAWLGGKKNDIDVVIGSLDGHEIKFADVMSWSTNKAMAVDIKNDIQGIGALDLRDAIAQQIYSNVDKEFVRMRMRNMKWLMRSFQPSRGILIALFILGVIAELALAYWSIANDITREHSWGSGENI